jgi:hypothetical protein
LTVKLRLTHDGLEMPKAKRRDRDLPDREAMLGCSEEQLRKVCEESDRRLAKALTEWDATFFKHWGARIAEISASEL